MWGKKDNEMAKQTNSVSSGLNSINSLSKGKGKLTVNELLHVKETAKINGEIVTDKLIVQAGAIFNVTCQMSGQVLSGFNTAADKKAS